MNIYKFHALKRIIPGFILFLCLFSLVQINLSYAELSQPKHYPSKFDIDGYVLKINIASQGININGYPYKMNLETTAYGREGEKISLLNLNNKVKVGVILLPFVKGQKRIVSEIWVLPENYQLRSKPL